MATGNHLLPLSLDSSQLLPVEAVFLSTGTYWKRGNEFFVCWKQYYIIPSFFSSSGNYY